METKMKSNMFNWLKPKNWGIVKVYRDFENFADWRRVIRQEEANPQSKYNKWKLERSKLYDIFLTVSLDETDAQLPEVIKRTKLLESLNPLNKYLDEDLGFAGSLSIELNQFEDDQKNLTLTYFIVYRFIFEKFSVKWLVSTILWLGLAGALIHYFNLLPLATAWLSSLI